MKPNPFSSTLPLAVDPLQPLLRFPTPPLAPPPAAPMPANHTERGDGPPGDVSRPGDNPRGWTDPSGAHNPGAPGSIPGPATPPDDLSRLARLFFRAGGAARFEQIHDEGWSVYDLSRRGWIKKADDGRWTERFEPAGELLDAYRRFKHNPFEKP